MNSYGGRGPAASWSWPDRASGRATWPRCATTGRERRRLLAGPGLVVYLIDSSVWIETFRRPARIDLPAVADLDEIVVCLPILQEVLQGFRDERAFRIARQAMLALPIVEAPLEAAAVEEAINLYRLARRTGVTVRSSVDCLIAVCAIRNDLTLLHHDRDFDQLARISPLRSHGVLTGP